MAVAEQLKALGRTISLSCGISARIAKRQACSRVIMYHGVTSATVENFARQLHYLSETFRVVPLSAMIRNLERQGTPTGNEIVLTFDDGLRNNLTLVYPLLQKLRVPATFFICPGLIGSGRWLWNHEARCRLQTLGRESRMQLARKVGATAHTVEGMVGWMKELKLQERRRVEDVLRVATRRYTATTEQREAFDIMSWDELKSLDPELITIGSHTFSHPILTTLSDDQLDFELRESRRILEEKLDREVGYFCYPNGSYDARVHRAVRAFYSAALTTESGLVTNNSSHDLHRLPRIPAAETTALMAWRLHRPGA
ncbi:MAG TPA: polysaccharide deacetylase family protein [Candidatus Limnocylindrales bacterium]|nr:polysaccharide deacetylase family protein [Candidatus Limnocylindrales bacterium]